VLAASGRWEVAVAGDRKTPAGWAAPGVRFLSADDQAASGYRLARSLPWNHYARKMMGYLAAVEAGAPFIAETDDDNVPREGWGFPPFDGRYDALPPGLGFVNVYRLFTSRRVWPRGFPLNRVTAAAPVAGPSDAASGPVGVGIWQGLADGDPDVDAIYRLTVNAPCHFSSRPPVVLGRDTVCPLNSQNTAFRREAFALLYLPSTVPFRVTDILRGYVAQPVLWAAGLRAGFLEATVCQERNPHDLMSDFESELPLYRGAEEMFRAAAGAVSAGRAVAENLFRSYEALLRGGWVAPQELDLLSDWLHDLDRAARG
jgi:hypothetical protein